MGINSDSRFNVKLTPSGKDQYRGLLGDYRPDLNGLELAWSEDLEREIYSRDQLQSDPDLIAPDDQTALRGALQNNITLRGILSALPDSDDTPLKAPIQEQTDFQGNRETIEQRVRRPLASNSDDESFGLQEEGQYSPYFARNDDYDGQVRDACETVDTEDTRDTEQLFSIPNQTFPATLDKLADRIPLTGSELQDLRNEITSESGYTLADKILVEHGDQPGEWRIEEVRESGDEDEVTLLARTTQNAIEFFADGSVGLPSGLLLAELVELLQDTQAQDDELPQNPPANGHDENDPKNHARFKYPIASAMRLILSFEDPISDLAAPSQADDVALQSIVSDQTDASSRLNRWQHDPVRYLLDLSGTEPLLAGGNHHLASVIGDVDEPPEYNLVLGDVFQSSEQVCLAWRFERELRGAAVDTSVSESFAATAELDRYVVQRRIFGSDRGVTTSSLLPTWLDPQNDPGLARSAAVSIR